MNDNPTPEQEVANELTRKMSQWRQANPQATLTEIEEAVEAELAQLRTQLVEEMIQRTPEASQEEVRCPQCDQNMVKNGRRKRKLKSKEGETIQLERQQWRCLACGTTLFPPG
jgi:transposase-like protein